MVGETGEYELAEAGGGESVVFYTAEKSDSSVTVSANYSEILNDITDGKTVIIRITVTDGGGTSNYNCTLAGWTSTTLVFTVVYWNYGDWSLKSLIIPKDDGMHGTPTFTSKTLT